MIKFVDTKEVAKLVVEMIESSDIMGVKTECRDDLLKDTEDTLNQKEENVYEEVMAEQMFKEIQKAKFQASGLDGLFQELMNQLNKRKDEQ